MLPERWKYFWYELLYYPVAVACFFFYGLRVKGRRHVPKDGGLLIVANHQSFLDPPLVGVAARRHLNYLARHGLFKAAKAFAWLIDSLGAVPINQEASGTEGIKLTLGLLKAGKAMLIFPEGARTPDGRMHDLKPGVVLLVRRAGVPVLPVGIAGVYEALPIHRQWFRVAPFFWPTSKASLAVVIGQPIPAKEFAGLSPEQILDKLSKKLHELHAAAKRLRRQDG